MWTPWMWPQRQTVVVSTDDDEEEEEAGTAEDKARFVAVVKNADKEYNIWSAAVTKDTWSGECLVPVLPGASVDRARHHHPSHPFPACLSTPVLRRFDSTNIPLMLCFLSGYLPLAR